MGISNYRDLQVWRRGIDLVQGVYELTREFPSDERYGLTSQMRRAAVSIPSNIAEGHARDSTKDFLRFLSIVQGSKAELETQLTLAERLGYCNQEQTAPSLDKLSEIGKMVRGLQKSLRSKL